MKHKKQITFFLSLLALFSILSDCHAKLETPLPGSVYRSRPLSSSMSSKQAPIAETTSPWTFVTSLAQTAFVQSQNAWKSLQSSSTWESASSLAHSALEQAKRASHAITTEITDLSPTTKVYAACVVGGLALYGLYKLLCRERKETITRP